MATEELVCAASELPSGKVTGCGPWAVGNSRGDYFAVTRRCHHLYADTIDSKGCLVCPWHGVALRREDGADGARPAGHLRENPWDRRGIQALTQVLPLGRGAVVERKGKIYVA
jgi:nitrite reductase/ring-hydroxylating ferredoxin subunit